MGSPSRLRALNVVIDAHGHELRDEIAAGLPGILRLVLEEIELRPGDTELWADAVIGDTDGTVVRMAVVSFTLDELAERFPGLGLGW